MRVSFVETMRGELKTRDGLTHPLDFELKAEAASLARFLRDGKADVAGVVHAPPWADEAEVEGTLTIDLPHRRLAYRLKFGALTLEGDKQVRLPALLSSMTVLPVTLADLQGVPLAAGEVRFDLRDLPSFAASWLPGWREAQKRLDVKRRSVARRGLA